MDRDSCETGERLHRDLDRRQQQSTLAATPNPVVAPLVERKRKVEVLPPTCSDFDPVAEAAQKR